MVSSTALLLASNTNIQAIDWGIGCCVMESWSWWCIKGTSGQNFSKKGKWHKTMKLTQYTCGNIHGICGERIQLSYSRSKMLKCLERFSSGGATCLAKCRVPRFYQMDLHDSIILDHSSGYDALVPDCIMHNRVKIVHTFVMTQSSICSYTIFPTFRVRV